jgi:hypothetical protein
MVNLPVKFAKELNLKPETGMGYQIINVILKDGRRFNQVIVVEGRITKIRGMAKIPFIEEDIDQIILTHEKWNFSKES